MASRLSTWWKRRKLARAAGGCNEAGMISCVRKGQLELVKKLLDFGVSVDAREETGRSVLFLAVRQGEIKLVDLLVERGANLDLSDRNGQTALMEAISQADKHVFDRLMKASPDLNKRDQQGNTALLMAVEEGNTTFTRSLIQAGADINLSNKIGKTPLMLAVMDSKTAIIQSLLEAGADPLQKDLSGKDVTDIPVSSPRIKKMLREYAGQEESEPDLRLNSMMNQMIHSAGSLLGSGSSPKQLEERGRQLLGAWTQFMGLPGMKESEATMQTGAELFLLLMQEVQRGLKQATSRSNGNGAASQSWENLETLVARLASQLPEPSKGSEEPAPEQHIHFHLPPLEDHQKEDLNSALKEAITVGSDRAAELLTKLGAITVDGDGNLSEDVVEEEGEEKAPIDKSQPDISE